MKKFIYFSVTAFVIIALIKFIVLNIGFIIICILGIGGIYYLFLFNSNLRSGASPFFGITYEEETISRYKQINNDYF